MHQHVLYILFLKVYTPLANRQELVLLVLYWKLIETLVIMTVDAMIPRPQGLAANQCMDHCQRGGGGGALGIFSDWCVQITFRKKTAMIYGAHLPKTHTALKIEGINKTLLYGCNMYVYIYVQINCCISMISSLLAKIWPGRAAFSYIFGHKQPTLFCLKPKSYPALRTRNQKQTLIYAPGVKS